MILTPQSASIRELLHNFANPFNAILSRKTRQRHSQRFLRRSSFDKHPHAPKNSGAEAESKDEIVGHFVIVPVHLNETLASSLSITTTPKPKICPLREMRARGLPRHADKPLFFVFASRMARDLLRTCLAAQGLDLDTMVHYTGSIHF